MSELDMRHFTQLKEMIDTRLEEVAARHAAVQTRVFPWLYGALGAVPAEVMFICENPSLAGLTRSNVETIDGEQPDLEAQWWGGSESNAATRFRPLLCDLGLKENGPNGRGGWRCYLTNLIKEATVDGSQNAFSTASRYSQARTWSDILAWEMEQVQPENVFCVGGNVYDSVKMLQREEMLPEVPIHKIWSYDTRGDDETVMENMAAGIREVLEAQPA